MISSNEKTEGTRKWFHELLCMLDRLLVMQEPFKREDAEYTGLRVGYPLRARVGFSENDKIQVVDPAAGQTSAVQRIQQSDCRNIFNIDIAVPKPYDYSTHPWLWVHEVGHIMLYITGDDQQPQNLRQLLQSTDFDHPPLWLGTAPTPIIDDLATCVMYLGMRAAGYSDPSVAWLTGWPKSVFDAKMVELEADMTTRGLLTYMRERVVPFTRDLCIAAMKYPRHAEDIKYSIALDLDGVLITAGSPRHEDRLSIDAVDRRCFAPFMGCVLPQLPAPTDEREDRPEVVVSQIYLSSSRRKLYRSAKDFYVQWALPEVIDPLVYPHNTKDKQLWRDMRTDIGDYSYRGQSYLEVTAQLFRQVTWDALLTEECQAETPAVALTDLTGILYRAHDRLSEIVTTILLNRAVEEKRREGLTFAEWVARKYAQLECVIVLDDSSDAHRPLSPYEKDLLSCAHVRLVHVKTTWARGLAELMSYDLCALMNMLRNLADNDLAPIQQHVD